MFTESLIFPMFQSLRFKVLLGLTYVANYDLILSSDDKENSYIHLGVQILTIPEISLKIIHNDRLRNIMFSKFKELTTYGKESTLIQKQMF